jgi:hypothetical protein
VAAPLVLSLALALTVPDPAVTPGAVRDLTVEQVCATKWGRDRRAVTAAMRRQVMALYGVAEGHQGDYELDHLIPRSMAGADVAINLWPQRWLEARQKDRLEVKMDRLVCAGEVSLSEAQEMFRTDWRAGYRRYVLGAVP